VDFIFFAFILLKASGRYAAVGVTVPALHKALRAVSLDGSATYCVLLLLLLREVNYFGIN
jgi:hypothetical protein